MRKGLAALGTDYDAAALEAVKLGLLARNGLENVPVAYIYVQVTRGIAPRTHAFPNPPAPPSVYGFANQYIRPAREVWECGYRAITVPDQRWPSPRSRPLLSSPTSSRNRPRWTPA